MLLYELVKFSTIFSFVVGSTGCTHKYKGMFRSTQFLINWFTKIDVVPNISVYVLGYRN